jgi:predicted signal transduction protein with EAL and GGDEF domain
MFAAAASSRSLAPKLRSVFVALGLLMAAASLVNLTHGQIEAHFYFFVLIVVLTLYEDWVPFLVAVAFVLGHHGVMGTLEAKQVYNSPDAWAHPWKWAIIHAAFVAMAGTAGVIAWRLNESVRNDKDAIRRQLAELAETDSLTDLPNRRRMMRDVEALFRGPDPEGLLVLLDLNGFKAYNDSFGHPAGDALLTRLSAKLARALTRTTERSCAAIP